MTKLDFSQIAQKYEKLSLIQKSAGEMLLDLLELKKNEDILDLGCGTGCLTRKLREITKGKVVGIDQALGMINEAMKEKSEITYIISRAEDLAYREYFDVIVANSSFQWFSEPAQVINNCYRALKPKGRMAVQTPARQEYSPNFIQAIKMVADNPKTRITFAQFNNPWLFYESADEYKILFEKCGFKVPLAKIELIKTLNTPEEVFKIFESGAAVGYLNQDFYKVPLTDSYIRNFRQTIRNAFHCQTNEHGKVELHFNRLYLIAVKE